MTSGTVRVGVLIIARNKDPKNESGWELLKPEDVPAWLNKPEILGELVDNQIIGDSSKDDYWYCAIQVPDQAQAIDALTANREQEPKSLILGAPRPKLTHSAAAVKASIDMSEVKPS